MGRRKDKGMEALQGMLEELLQSIEENGDFSEFGFGEDDFDADQEVYLPEFIRVFVDSERTGEDMLDDLDREDLMDLAVDMYHPEELPENLTYRQLREKVHSFILTKPMKFLAMLPGNAVDALSEALQGNELAFEDWESDLDTLTESGLCVFDAMNTLAIPEEYAKLFTSLLEQDDVRQKLKYWSELEEAATDILMDEEDPMAMRELIRRVCKEVRPAAGAKKNGKVVSFESPSAAAQEQKDEIYYVLANRLTGWDTDIMMFEGEDDVYLSAMDWDEAEDSEFWEGEDFPEEDDDIWEEDEEDSLDISDLDDDLPFR